MFTILNLLNYAAGKPVNVYILITITVVVYFYLIKYYWDTIYESYLYTAILLILLILDIITIVLVFFYDRKINESNSFVNSESNIVSMVNSESNNALEEKEEKKERKGKKSKSKKNKENKEQTKDENPKIEKNYVLGNNDKELISLFDINKDPSLVTY